MVEGSGGNLITCYSFLEQSARDILIQGVDYKCYRRRPPTTILAIKIFRTAQMYLESSSTQTACSTRYVLGYMMRVSTSTIQGTRRWAEYTIYTYTIYISNKPTTTDTTFNRADS
jgi:hypothetical protein